MMISRAWLGQLCNMHEGLHTRVCHSGRRESEAWQMAFDIFEMCVLLDQGLI